MSPRSTVTAGMKIGSWHEANQHHLLLAMDQVRKILERHGAAVAASSPSGTATRKRLPLSIAQDGPPPSRAVTAQEFGAPALEILTSLFGLSEFERDVLVMCAAADLDASFGTLCASVQGDARRTAPTFGLALAALPAPHWSAITPSAPLRRWRLIELGAGETLTSSPLRVDERVLHYLTGIGYLDERIQGLVEPLVDAGLDLPGSHRALAERIAAQWSLLPKGAFPPLVELCGPGQREEKRAIVNAASAYLGMQVHAVAAPDLPLVPSERDALARLWEREAALSGSVLLVDCEDLDNQSEALRGVVAFAVSVQALVALATREPLRAPSRPTVRLNVQRPGTREQRDIWAQALGPLAQSLNGQLDRLVGQFSLGPAVIRAACATALDSARDAAAPPIEQRLWDACREQTRSGLDDLALRIEPAASWDDLVLPDQQKGTLREIAAHVRQRIKVYETWGFAARNSRGLGISALFAGASGTGKTMAAEVLAEELSLQLYRVDLSSVVSKYIGETEKNLRRVFDAAEEGGAILLFDEADALFGKRSEVKDSHDRYANIEVSYLLQRMESYRGLAILTTNFKEALDSAFMRRIRFVIHFPFPDADQRGEIWRRIFPSATPTEDLQIERLARLNVAGGNIRNIALNAAFLAADAGEPVRMGHLLQAARGEYAKLEKPLTDAEVGRWA